MWTRFKTSAFLLAAAPILLAGTASAQLDDAPTLEEVQTVVAEAMEAVSAYSEAQRAEAVAEAEMALEQLDAAVANRQREMREAWVDLTESAREDADERLAELQSALVGLAERVGTLQAGADSAWDELNAGLLGAWDTLSAAVSASLEAPEPAE